MRAGAGIAVWEGDLFGLRVGTAFEMVGCDSGGGGDGSKRVTVELGDRATVRRAVDPKGATVIGRIQDAAGRWKEHVRAHPHDGYLVTSPRHGAFHINSSGERIVAAPGRVPPWLWQRALVGEALPFVSALRGLETLHASAVVIGGGAAAIAVSGPSGAGKSSIAADLVLGGATLLADDVVALTCERGVVMAHPGPSLMSLRVVTVDRLGHDSVSRLGTALGTDARGIRVAVPRHGTAIPLSSLYCLEVVAAGGSVQLEAARTPDPRLLLACTFNFILRSPARLINQLEVCAGIAAAVRVVKVRIPRGADHQMVASKIRCDAEQTVAARRTTA